MGLGASWGSGSPWGAKGSRQGVGGGSLKLRVWGGAGRELGRLWRVPLLCPWGGPCWGCRFLPPITRGGLTPDPLPRSTWH